MDKTKVVKLSLLHNITSSRLNLVLGISDEVPLLKHMNSKSNYLSMLINSFSHEIKTPLTKILMLLDSAVNSAFGSIETLVKKSPRHSSAFSPGVGILPFRLLTASRTFRSGDVKPNFETKRKPAEITTESDKLFKINDITRNLLFFINGILDFAKVINNRIDLSKKQFNVSQMLLEVTSGFESVLEDKGVDLIVDCDPNVELFTDRKVLQEILYILLDNAAKFTTLGGVRVRYSIDDTSRHATFKVIDTGCGCNPDDIAILEKILMEPFIAEQKTRSSAGLGIGLRTAQALILALTDGETRLSITSKKREGTTVSFSVPILPGQKSPTFGSGAICQSVLARVPEYVPKTQDTLSLDSGSSLKPEDIAFRQEREDFTKEAINTIAMYVKAFTEFDELIHNSITNSAKPQISLKMEFNSSNIYDYSSKKISENKFVFEPNSPEEIRKMIKKPDNPVVLIVDDDEMITDLLSGVLEQLGVETIEANSGEEALAICDRLAFSKTELAMVITDFNMPEMNGVELAQQLKTDEYKSVAKYTPIVILTAQDEASTRKECLDAGVSEFLSKPISSKDLKVLFEKYQIFAACSPTKVDREMM